MTLQELVVKIKADTKDFDKKMSGVRKGLDKASKGMAIAGAAVAGGLAYSIKKASDFETQMANVSTMLDKNTMSYMPQFSKGIKNLSESFGESTSTLSKGLYDILSASVAPAKALDVLKVSVKSAAAGLTDTGVAADAITTILNSYGMSADKAGEVSDKLFGVVKRGKTTFAELAPSIGRVASTASMAGLNFNELGAAIATMTRAGISTDEAMTSINGVLQAFLKPGKDAQKVASKFGLELNSTTLKTIGLVGVMKKLKGASAEQLATIFPNIRGLKGIAAALGDTTGFAKDYNLMLHSTGLTEEAFKKQSNTLAFQMKQVKESLNEIAVTIGTSLLPIVKDFTTNHLVPLIKRFEALPKPVKDNIAKFGLLTATILLVGAAVTKLISAIMGIIPAISAVMKFASALIATNPVLLMIAGIVAAVALLVIAWKRDWGHIREHFKAFVGFFKGKVSVIGKGFDTMTKKLAGFVDKIVNKIPLIKSSLDKLKESFKNIEAVVSPTLDKVKAFFKKIADKATEGWHKVTGTEKSWTDKSVERWSGYAEYASKVYGNVTDKATKATQKAIGATQKVTAVTQKAVEKNVYTIQDLQSALTDYLSSAYQKQLSDKLNVLGQERDRTVATIQYELNERRRQYEEQISLIERERDSRLGVINQQISALMKQHEEEQRETWLTSERKALAEAKTAEERQRIIKEINNQQAEWAYEAKLDSLRKQADAIRKEADKEIKTTQTAYEKDKANLERRLHNVKTYYDMQKSYIQKYYEDLDLLRNRQAEAQKILASTTLNQILTMLEKTKSRWAKLGSEIGDTFWSSLTKAIDISKALGGKVVPGLSIGKSNVPGFASGGFVSSPTLAVVGERPEYIIPASQMDNSNLENLLGRVLSELRKLNVQTMPETGRNIALSVNGMGSKI